MGFGLDNLKLKTNVGVCTTGMTFIGGYWQPCR